MDIIEVEQAIREAEGVLAKADFMALQMAKILKGRLRCVSSNSYTGYLTLKALKAELRHFNAKTGKWDDEA